MIAKTFQGLEEVLAKELIELGANDVQIGRRMVSFTGDKAMMYKANFCLRTAIRILKPIKQFKASDADEIYNALKPFEWECYMDINTSFAVDSVVYSDDFRHSKFVAYKVKDAIADHFRDREGRRPSVEVANPDLLFHIHIADNQCTLSLDSSGESLHRRGYRQDAVAAPLNEVLAAGMILMTGWQGETDFIDPMCGSGTLPIEAALIARGIAPGVFRKEFAFEKWTDFDAELFDSIYNDDSTEREFTHHIYGYDNDWKAVNIAKANVRSAGMTKYIDIEHRELEDFTQPEAPAIMVTNPPYGERLKPDDLYDLYRLLGTRLKNAFQGNQAWIISYKEECFNKIGLKPSTIVPLFNGALPCELRKYELFSGRFSEFRESGEQLDKSDRPLKERRPLHLRQAAAEKSDKDEKAEKRDKLGLESREEEQAYQFRLERHNEFARLQQARERKEKRAAREEKEKNGADGFKRENKESRPFREKRDFKEKKDFKEKRDFKGPRDGKGFSGSRKSFGEKGRSFSKGNNRGGNFKKNNFNNKKGRS
jgi:putative N6-adenine-specific DNA methylase